MTMATVNTIQALVYSRVSTEDQAKNYSLETQEKACGQYAKSEGWPVAEVFKEDGYSGTTLERPALDRLRDRMADGGRYAVVVHDLDRLSRRLVDLEVMDAEFKRYEVDLRYVLLPTDESPESQLFVQIRGAFSQFEVKKFQERARRGKLGRAEAGVPSWPAPYGYDYVSEGRWMAHWGVIPEQAGVVREIYRLLLEDGLSVRAITTRLLELKIPAQKGGGWRSKQVHTVLTNSAYMGIAYWNKNGTKEPKKRRNVNTRNRRGTRAPKPREQWVEIAVPAIIDGTTFNAAKKRLSENIHRSVRKSSKEYLLTGHLFCKCGRGLYGTSTSGSTKVTRYYRCNAKYGSNPVDKGKCDAAVLNADRVEAAVWGRIEEILRDPETIDRERQNYNEATQKQTERHSFELDVKKVALKDIERKYRQWDKAYENDAIDLADYKEKKLALKDKQ